MEDEKTISNGDVVFLKSGGPSMVVSKMELYDRFTCQWFIGGKVESLIFEEHVLTKEKPNKLPFE